MLVALPVTFLFVLPFLKVSLKPGPVRTISAPDAMVEISKATVLLWNVADSDIVDSGNDDCEVQGVGSGKSELCTRLKITI